MAEPTYILVPGAGGVGALWRLVVDELGRRGIPAVAVDLPADDEQAGLPEYAELLVEAAGDAAEVVLVGQSMGAFSAVLAAARLPTRRLVLHNAMIPALGETPGQWWDNVGFAQAKRDNDIREGRDPDADVDLEVYFLHDTPPDLADEVRSTGRGEAEVAFTDTLDLPAWPDVETRVIAGRDDRFFPVAFQQRLARERLGVAAEVIPGGHLAAISHPRELVDVLTGYDSLT